MKIIIIGATGTLGSAVANQLAKNHDIIRVGRNNGDYQVDIANISSIKKMYQSIGKFDALIATTGKVHFAALTDMTHENYLVGLNDKLMGQVNLVMQGLSYIHEGGSFTLTSGILNEDPIRYGTSAAMVNAAIEGFVKGAAIELPNRVRINAVSPTVVSESLDKYGSYFKGFPHVPATRVAEAYVKSVEGAQTGQIYKVWC